VDSKTPGGRPAFYFESCGGHDAREAGGGMMREATDARAAGVHPLNVGVSIAIRAESPGCDGATRLEPILGAVRRTAHPCETAALHVARVIPVFL
jgi:hypothetical protein